MLNLSKCLHMSHTHAHTHTHTHTHVHILYAHTQTQTHTVANSADTQVIYPQGSRTQLKHVYALLSVQDVSHKVVTYIP